jgi:hypothetical protein
VTVTGRVLRRIGGLCLVSAAVPCLVGCMSLPATLVEQLDAGVSATASGRTVMQQLASGDALPAFADTVLSDGLSELEDSVTQVEGLKPDSADEMDDRASTLAVLRQAVDAILGAREAVGTEDELGAAERALDEANTALSELAEELG